MAARQGLEQNWYHARAVADPYVVYFDSYGARSRDGPLSLEAHGVALVVPSPDLKR